MSENKFISRLKGEPTPKSVVEIQNDRLVAPFKSSPMGYIADRDSSVVVAKGAQNWAVNQGQLVPVSDDYIGTESDLTATSRVSGAGLWLNATYAFPATGDETNPVSAIIAPSAKWVLTLCGDSLITQNGSVITLTMLVKIGATHLTTKQFKVRECASQFSQRLAIDFSESEQSVIKAHGGSPLTVQVLCDDEGASATIYSGMTHLTLLQRKIDADLVATDNVLLPEFIENLLEGYIIPADYFSRYDYIEQVEDGGKAMPEFTRNGDNMTFTGWAKPAEEVYTKTEIDDKFTVANAQIDANATAIQKTRDDMNEEDGRLQTQITAQATAIAGKQDQLTAGDNITIVDNVISATGGGGGDFLPLAGGTMTGNINFEYGSGEQFIGAATANGGILISFKRSTDSRYVDYYFEPFGFFGRVLYSDYKPNLGKDMFPWGRAYIQKINSGNGGADIIVPSEGGTLARLEDVATKQDQLVAGDNIVISGNTISATGGGGGDFLPLAGGTMTGNINFEYGSGEQFIGASEANGGILISLQGVNDSRYANYYFEGVNFYGRNMYGNYNLNLGHNMFPWGRAYIQKINNGNGGADIIVPAEGGTLARLEDVATKQDQLVAGDNIVISGNTISATGAGGGTGFDVQVVQELPATGQKGIIYLLAKDGAAPDVYDEYVWIESTQTFELIGTTQVDLTDYATKEELGGYLPTIGGTMTGTLNINSEGSFLSTGKFLSFVSRTSSGNYKYTFSFYTVYGSQALFLSGGNFYPFGENQTLGSNNSNNYRWKSVATRQIYNGGAIDVPTKGGTMALLEDINAIGGVGTVGQVLTKTADGMVWADASGGDGDIDCGVMS